MELQQRDMLFEGYEDIPLLPVSMQSTPKRELFSLTWRDLIEARVSMGLRPEFSASAKGIASKASANARMAYCSIPGLCENVRQMTQMLVQNLAEANSTYLHSSILNSNGAGNFGSTTTVDDTVIAHKVAHNAKGIVQRTLGLVNDLVAMVSIRSRQFDSAVQTDHFVASSYEDRDGAAVGALLDH